MAGSSKLLGGNTVTDADPLQTGVTLPLPAGTNTIGAVGTTAAKSTGTKGAPAAVNVSTVAQIVAANVNRQLIYIQNTSQVADLYIGKDNTVTAVNGLRLGPGGMLIDDATNDAWFGVASAGTISVSYLEVT